MKNLIVISLLFITTISYGQNEQPLDPFDRIVASQFVKVVLEKGEKESIRLIYSGVEPEAVNVKVKRKKLHIYLDDARLVGKQDKYYYNGMKHSVSRYKNSSITAYITYRELHGVEIRGEESLVCNGALNADKFKLTIYGENDVTLSSIHSKKFKASIFGSNNVEIKSGEASHQVYRLFGENKIDTQNLLSHTASSRIYGVGRLTLNASDELKITAFGEPEIRLAGSARINKSIVVGELDLKVRR